MIKLFKGKYCELRLKFDNIDNQNHKDANTLKFLWLKYKVLHNLWLKYMIHDLLVDYIFLFYTPFDSNSKK